MDPIALGPLNVTRLALGTMLFGDSTPPDEAERIFDAYLDAGHNFVDTADTYSDGVSEQTLAPFLARRRDDVVLATKAHGSMGEDPNHQGNNRRWLVREV